MRTSDTNKKECVWMTLKYMKKLNHTTLKLRCLRILKCTNITHQHLSLTHTHRFFHDQFWPHRQMMELLSIENGTKAVNSSNLLTNELLLALIFCMHFTFLVSLLQLPVVHVFSTYHLLLKCMQPAKENFEEKVVMAKNLQNNWKSLTELNFQLVNYCALFFTLYK